MAAQISPVSIASQPGWERRKYVLDLLKDAASPEKKGRKKKLDTICLGFPGGVSGKEPTCQCRRCKETWVRSLGREDALEEGTATHSSILAWRIPWTEEPGGLQPMGSQSQTQLSN